MATLKDRLRQLRKQYKLTQKEVAEFLGITESAYGFYEQGRNEPSLETIRKLAKKYDVNISYLMGESDIPSGSESIKDKKMDGLAFIDGETPLTEEEKEYLKESLELFRRMKAKREQQKP
jgi:transcriptional regulator with XRE-family HTH domain